MLNLVLCHLLTTTAPVFTLLLATDVDKETEDKRGDTPLPNARDNGHAEIVAINLELKWLVAATNT